jgi:probable HAF family extracellular repeat protein
MAHPAPSQKDNLPGCAAAHYRVIAIPLRPFRVNDGGAVAGMTKEHRAAWWTEKHGLTTIDLPAGFHHAEATDVNLHEQVLGTASTADGARRQSFLYADGKLTLVEGDSAKAIAINAHGDLAGEAKLAGTSSTGPALWKQGKPVALGACCGGRATALNDRGEVVGEAYDKQGRYQAFVWDEKAGLRRLGPADTYSTAVAINQRGHVVVYAFTEGSSLYRDGNLTAMELSKRWPSQPRAMNGCDIVVGSFGSNSDESEAFLWDEKSGFRNLNELLPKSSGWKLEVAISINEHGEIAGWGDHGGEDDAGFLLIPVPQ